MNNYKFLDLINTEIVKYKKDDKYYVSFNIFLGFCDIYGYSIFLPISSKLSRSYNGNEIFTFINNIRVLNNSAEISQYIIDGIDSFVPGVDYYVSQSLGDFIGADEEIIMPDYLLSTRISVEQNYEDYEDLSETYNKDIPNINYYISKNFILDDKYSEEDLLNFATTFMKVISEQSTFTDYNYGTNAIYKLVIDYFANGQSDCALTALNLVKGYSQPTTTTTSCGCSTQSSCFNISGITSSTTSSSYNSLSGTNLASTCDCVEEYKNAILYYLQQMLSDPRFYCDWMNIDISNNDSNKSTLIPNEPMIDELIHLLELLKQLGYDISNSNTNTYCSHYRGGNDCGDLSDVDICSQYKTIDRFIQVLNWVKNGEINENVNKIKIYGKEFAVLFPNLYF